MASIARDGLDFDKIYPVGSIYMSTNGTNPHDLFGGTWEQLRDRFLLAAGPTYGGGSTGGSANHTHTSAAHTHTTTGHTLTIDEIPKHTGHLDPNARPKNTENGNPNNSSYLDYKNNITGYTSSGNNYGWVVNHGNEAYPATESRGGGAIAMVIQVQLLQAIPVLHLHCRHILLSICGKGLDDSLI